MFHFHTRLFFLAIIFPLFVHAGNISNDTIAIKSELRKLDREEMDWGKKETAARDLLRRSEKAGYSDGALHASYVLATSYFFRQEYQHAYEVLDSMLLRLDSGADDLPAGKILEDKKSRIYSFIGTIFDEIGDYNKAIDYYLLSLKTVETFGDNYEKAVLYKNLGMTNLAVGNTDIANDYFTKALDICKITNDKKTIFDIYNALQSHYADSADYETALRYGLQMLSIAEDDSDSYSLALANNALGNIYLSSGKSTLAEGFLNEAVDLSEQNHYETILAQALSELASLKLQSGEFKSARQLAEKAMALAERNSILSLKTQAALTLARVYEGMGDYPQALVTYKLFEADKDTENKNKNARAVLEAQTRFEMDRMHQEKKLLEDQLLIKQYQVSKRNYFLIGTIIILALLIAFLAGLVRRYRHVRRLNRQLHEQQVIINEQETRLHREKERMLNMEIEHKNRELTSIAMTLTQENEFKQDLIGRLEKLRLALGPGNKQDIRNINSMVNSIKQQMSTNAWEEFRTYFDNVYSTFYTNLNEKFPFLSQSDKKLCAMLKLGLSTKEISMLTFREIKSVESARNRLRRKMNLDPKTNLVQFLAEF